MPPSDSLPGSVDLNADLGEEITDDAGLLGVVTSANVACGYHAGSVVIMHRVCAEAALRGVVVGAQVSYADRAGFGREAKEVASDVLREQVADQVGVLRGIAEMEGATVRYVKAHGALYHRVLHDPVQAAAMLAGSSGLPVLTMADSVIGELAVELGVRIFTEGFPDRAYTAAGRLVPRSEAGAVLTDDGAVTRQAVALAPQVDSLCVHGDHPGAVARAHAVRAALTAAGWRLQAADW